MAPGTRHHRMGPFGKGGDTSSERETRLPVARKLTPSMLPVAENARGQGRGGGSGIDDLNTEVSLDQKINFEREENNQLIIYALISSVSQYFFMQKHLVDCFPQQNSSFNIFHSSPYVLMRQMHALRSCSAPWQALID